MLCYRDMTFCTFFRDCSRAGECSRPLTDAVIDAANKWWGGDGAPISQFIDKPDCHLPNSEAAP